MGPGDGTQVAGRGGKYLYLLSHLACPYLLFYNNMFLVMSVEDHLTFFMVLLVASVLIGGADNKCKVKSCKVEVYEQPS